MPHGERARRSERGFTYLGLLVLVALIGVMLAAAGEVASTAAQREREAQLLWVGHEYRAAIGRYFSHRRAYPQTLQELLGAQQDAPVPVRYIRRLYPDPMTNAVDWVLVPAPAGGIMGVASSSKRAPRKTGLFDEADKDFADAKSYSDWQFTFLPSGPRPSSSPPPPPPPSPRSPPPSSPSPSSPRPQNPGAGAGPHRTATSFR